MPFGRGLARTLLLSLLTFLRHSQPRNPLLPQSWYTLTAFEAETQGMVSSLSPAMNTIVAKSVSSWLCCTGFANSSNPSAMSIAIVLTDQDVRTEEILVYYFCMHLCTLPHPLALHIRNCKLWWSFRLMQCTMVRDYHMYVQAGYLGPCCWQGTS